MFYKLFIISFFLINVINNVNATLNENINNDLLNSITKDDLLNKNSSSLNSIASTNSNSSTCNRESVEEDDSNNYIQHEDCNTILLQNSIYNGSQTKIKYSEDYINKCFMENCDMENLDINNGKKHLLKLYNEFERISELKDDKTPINKLNDRFFILVNIAYSFIKVNKTLELNDTITDEDIQNINDLSYNLYYENGLFTRDVIIKYFNLYKDRLIQLLHPLIDF